MAGERLPGLINQLRRLAGRRSGCTLTDAELLGAFVARGDEASFEVLVWRHGGMVLRLCQRVLRDSHEAEDAFQATFLVFARKAGAIGKGEAVGGWLHRVACRVALRVRGRAVKRGTAAELADDLAAPEAADELLWRDLRPVLDEEIERLPEKFRAAVVLCYLQGHTTEEAAEQLGCPKGTVQSRLARGRERLQSRLARRGLALSAGWAVLVMSRSAGAAPPGLVCATLEAALAFAAGEAAAGLVPASVAALTEGVLHAMFLTKLKVATAALLALAVLGMGTGLFAHRSLAARPAPDEPAAARAAARPAEAAARAAEKPADKAEPAEVAGTVVAVAEDGKSFTLELRSRSREEGAKKVEVRLADKTAVTYHHVSAKGARPTVGYFAQVRLSAGGKGEAAGVAFHGSEDALRRGPDVTGRVAAVAKDGKGLTLELTRAGRRGETREAKKVEIAFNDKTVVLFTAVGRDGAKLTEGYDAAVWLEGGPGGKTAGSVRLSGKGERLRRQADLAGEVVAVAEGGKALTLLAQPQTRGEEPKKVEVKVGAKTGVFFQNVAAGGAKLAPGLRAQVWLAEGSKDSAAVVSLSAVPKERWPRVAGTVVGVSKDGKTITLEAERRSRREEPKKFDVKITERTRVTYYGVGPGEAKPAEGYHAAVLLGDDKETAQGILFNKPGSGRRR
jgi:RNA polymerase sigma factor (sigma-70 family)